MFELIYPQYSSLKNSVSLRFSPYISFDEENNNLEVYRACKNVGTVSIDEINAKAEENMAKRKSDKQEQLKRLKQVRAIISKYRDESLSAIVEVPETVKTKNGKVHTKTSTKAKVKRAKFQGSSGLELTELKKAQFKQFLIDLKRTAGLEILFHKGEDGKVKGYSVIDNSKGTIYNGSDVMKLSALLNGKGMNEEIIPADLAEEVNQEYRDERTAKRDNIAPSNIYDVVKGKMKELNLFLPEPDSIDPEAYSLSSEENCQKAIELITLAETQHANGNWRWEVTAEMAAEHAYAAFVKDKRQKETTAVNTQKSQTQPAEQVHQEDVEKQQRPVQQQPKQEVKPVQPKSVSNKPWTIPFTDVKASVVIVNGQPFLTATINGRQHNKKILPGHYAWYQQEPYQQKAALGLAMHYFGDDIHRTQQNSYQKAFMERGKMPYSISLDYARLNTNGSMYFCNHQFRLPDGDTWSTGCEISREDFIDGINNRKSAEQIAIDNFGSKLLKEFNIGLDNLMHSIVMTASKDSVDDLKKSIGFFDEISHNHIAEFAQAFGTATLEVVLGGTHNVVGMGGTDTSLNRKPDDKDETTYQGMKSSKKKGVSM